MTRLASRCAALAVLGLGAPDAADKPLTDRQFVKRVAEINDAEKALGMLAKEQGGSAGVKAYGQRMIDDHSRAARELQEAARKGGIEAAVPDDRKHRQMARELLRLKGAAFDRAYLKLMQSDHERALVLFKAEARDGQDPGLKAFAARMVPAGSSPAPPPTVGGGERGPGPARPALTG
jgi:putative membrane protein